MQKPTRTTTESTFLYILFFLSLILIVVLEFTAPNKQVAQQTLPPPQKATSEGVVSTLPRTLTETEPSRTSTPVTAPILPRAKKKAAPTAPVAKAVIPPISAPPPLSTLIPTETVNKATRAALVNIICTAKNSGVFHPVSGSGVIIDPRGVILTNAHLANVLLLKDYPTPNFVECIIRTGSPARNMYRAELLYISSIWVRQNKNNIIEENPTGTGENDFALLRITESIAESEPLPDTFPFIQYEIDENSIAEGQSVLIAAYPASFLGGITIQKDLHITSTVSNISKLYTFDQDGLLDLISVGTNIVAQKGSSGGAVVRQQSGKLTALIVTSSEGESTGARELNAITLAHINRSLKKEMGFDLQNFLATDLVTVAHDFQTIIAKGLTETLIAVVEQ